MQGVISEKMIRDEYRRFRDSFLCSGSKVEKCLEEGKERPSVLSWFARNMVELEIRDMDAAYEVGMSVPRGTGGDDA